MSSIGTLLSYLIGAYMLLVMARVFLDWIPPFDSAALRFLTLWAHRLTEPLLSPLRRMVPMIPLGEGSTLDLTPAVLMLCLLVLRLMIGRLIG